jgi:hypothetical protein
VYGILSNHNSHPIQTTKKLFGLSFENGQVIDAHSPATALEIFNSDRFARDGIDAASAESWKVA